MVYVHSSYMYLIDSFSKPLPWKMSFCTTYGLVLNSHDDDGMSEVELVLIQSPLLVLKGMYSVRVEIVPDW